MPSQARLKRAFVMPFFGIQALILVHAGIRLATGGGLAWAGPLLGAGAFFGFMGWMAGSGRARTSPRLPGLLAASAAGLVLAAAATAAGGAGALPVVYAGLLLAGHLLYVFWYSRLDREPSPALQPGSLFPDVELEDADGQPVSTGSLRGRPAVLLFHRGNWCPLCMAQVRELADRWRELERRGAAVVLVSPQSHENTRKLAARFDVPFRFWVDRGCAAARKLGLLHEGGVPLGMRGYDPDTIFPTAVVLDAEGRVVMADQTDNYRVRPEPDSFLRALAEAAGPA